MTNITYTIQEAKSCGNSKEKPFHIYVEGDGITRWNMPYLKQAKLKYSEYYEIWTREPKEQVLEDFIALYGNEFEKLVNK